MASAPTTVRVLLLAGPNSLEGTVAALERRGVKATRAEPVRRAPAPLSLKQCGSDGTRLPDVWVVTSRAVVDLVLRRRVALAARLCQIPRVIAVGPRTAEALSELGAHQVEQGLGPGIDGIVRRLGDLRGQRVLYLRSDMAGGTLARRLRSRGAVVVDRVAYRVRPLRLRDRLRLRQTLPVDVVLASSPSVLRGFLRALAVADRRALARQALLLALGPTTGRAARRLGFRHVRVSPASSAQGFTRFVVRTVRDARG